MHFSNDVETEFVLKNLIQQQSNGYIFALEAKNKCFIGASPERLVKKKDQLFFLPVWPGQLRGEKQRRRRYLCTSLTFGFEK
ncbi:chorismate-binding protein [Niallia circulans]